MSLRVEDLDNKEKYREIAVISYNDLISFILGNLRQKSALMVSYWCLCIFLMLFALRLRIYIHGNYPLTEILFHSLLGAIVFPILVIPLHEFLHILPYWLSGARRIRVGMDVKQYLFYVTAHRHVANAVQFKTVAWVPFISVSAAATILIFLMPGLWKWSISLFLFVHTTMCAGDFALLNFYWINRDKKIHTWDDADQKMAYFYEEITEKSGNVPIEN
ncbi:MAG: DUF3267 domain-containing protein [Bacteroidales bacterium]|jgi:hypothetical protein|nr:DUF3267 domain-containing protein [Bacteroidales bacterium]